MRKKTRIILTITTLIIITSIGFYKINYNKLNTCKNTNYCELTASTAKMNYNGFKNEDNIFKEATVEKLFNTIENKGSGIYYFGYTACPWCEDAVPIMNEIAKEQKININYISTKNEDNEAILTDNDLEKILNLTNDYLEEDENGTKKLYVPFVITIKDGKVIAGNIGTVKGHNAIERNMTETEINSLKKIYTNMFEL